MTQLYQAVECWKLLYRVQLMIQVLLQYLLPYTVWFKSMLNNVLEVSDNNCYQWITGSYNLS